MITRGTGWQAALPLLNKHQHHQNQNPT